MHNLFGDRFLRLFAGDLQPRLKGTKSYLKNQYSKAIAEGAAEPIDPASEEGHENNLAEEILLPNEDEQNK